MVMIETGQFCTVESSRYVDYGIKRGEVVYLAGDMMVPVEEKDPYTYRKLFVAAYTDGGHVKAERKPISIDAINLKPVSSAKQEELKQLMEDDFKQEDTDEVSD